MGLHVMEQTKLMVRNLYTEALPVQAAEPAGSLGPRLVVFVVRRRKQIFGILILRGQCKLLQAGLGAFKDERHVLTSDATVIGFITFHA